MSRSATRTTTLKGILLSSLAVAALLLTGCSATPGSDPSTPAAAVNSPGASTTVDQLIEDGLSQAKSDFQIEVLTKAKDAGTISEADWKEANNRYKSCLSEQGYDVEVIYEGSRVLLSGQGDPSSTTADSKEENDKRQKVELDCYQKTSAFINEIYAYLNGGGAGNGMDGDTVQRAILACLIDRKLVPASTTYDEFVADLEQNNGKNFTPNGQPNEDEFAKCWIENTQ